MGRVQITGPDAEAFLQRVQTWDVSALRPGRAHYSLLLNEAAGIIDDIFVYHREASWLLVINAANAPRDVDWLKTQARGLDVTLRDLREETCLVAIQGPAAMEILQELSPKEELAGLAYHRVVERSVAGARVVLCTTGYTGEPGCELLLPAGDCVRVWEAILAAGASRRILPCGLAARDSLRAEACFPLYGNEIDETTDPHKAGLMRAAVRLEGHEFVGRRALAAVALQPLKEILVGFQMSEPGVPRHGYGIVAAAGGGAAAIGRVTTGLFSPSTGKYLGMGYVEASHAAEGSPLGIVIRGSHKPARVVGRPFYKSPHWR